MVMQFYFYQQRIAIAFVDVFLSNKNSSPEIVEIEREGPITNWRMYGWAGGRYVYPFPALNTPFFEEGTEPLFAAFYCPERVPTKHLPPYPATNIIICTSIALPMTQRSTLNIYSSRYRSRAVCLVWRFGLRMVFDRLDTYTQQNENI